MFYYPDKSYYVKAQSAAAVMQLGQAYVPDQKFQHVYPAEKALKAGTVFQDLDLPYGGRGYAK